jgi:chromosome partitioning protein
MRIRRRDKDHIAPGTYRPSGQSPVLESTTIPSEHPTASDPVQLLIADPPASPPPVQTSPPEPPAFEASPLPAPSAPPPAPPAQASAPPAVRDTEPEVVAQASVEQVEEVADPVPQAPATPKPRKPRAAKPKAAKAARPPATAPKAPETRRASIAQDAEELLDGVRPVTRELPRVIAVANQKGGVGKTTTTVNLGAALAELDYRVLVVDLDPQGNATTGLGIDARNFELSMYDVIMRDQPMEDCIEPTSVKNLFVAPATIDLAGIEIELVPAFSRELKVKKAIDSVTDDFDFILIDCPPSLGLITVNGLAAAGEVMVPIQCEYYALEGLSQLLRNVNLVSSNLNESLEVTTIVLTMFDARTRLSIDVANEVREHFSDRVCRATIPRTVRLSEAPSFGQPITVFDPTSRGAVAYRELAKEVSNGAPQRSR